MKVSCAVLALASLICLCASSNQVCKCGWTYHNGHCYFFSTKTATWYMAASKCRAEGGYLVKVSSGTENAFLKSFAKLFGKKFSHARTYGFWIGASDFHSEGKWRWEVDNNVMSYRNFLRGQPDNYKGREDCAHLWGKAQGYQWNDANCHTQIYYICEADVFNKPSCTCRA